MTHEGKYDDFVVNSYLQYDKDKNNSITGRVNRTGFVGDQFS